VLISIPTIDGIHLIFCFSVYLLLDVYPSNWGWKLQVARDVAALRNYKRTYEENGRGTLHSIVTIVDFTWT
jgi:hypothetical protein